MNVAVAYKWAADPQEAGVGQDGAVDWSRATATISEYDAVAIEVGVRCAHETGGECVGISAGTSPLASSLAKKAAMSRGLDRGLLVADDALAGANETLQAQVLAELVRRAGVEVLITGDTSIDENARMMSALVAGYLRWPCLQEVEAIRSDAGRLSITQAAASGSREVSLQGPAVVAVATDAVPAKVPGMKDILAAGRKPVEQVQLDEISRIPVALEIIASARPARKARRNELFSGDDAARRLILALHADGSL